MKDFTPKPLTAKETLMIFKIAEDQFTNGEPETGTWTSAVCETQSDKAVFGSLVKKGYAATNGESCNLTKPGLEVYYAMKPKTAEEVDRREEHSDGQLTPAQIAQSFLNRVEEETIPQSIRRLGTFLDQIRSEVQSLLANK